MPISLQCLQISCIATCKHPLKMLSSDSWTSMTLTRLTSVRFKCRLKMLDWFKVRCLNTEWQSLRTSMPRVAFLSFEFSVKFFFLALAYWQPSNTEPIWFHQHKYLYFHKKCQYSEIGGAHLMVRRSQPRMAVSFAVASWLQLWWGLHLPEVNLSWPLPSRVAELETCGGQKHLHYHFWQGSGFHPIICDRFSQYPAFNQHNKALLEVIFSAGHTQDYNCSVSVVIFCPLVAHQTACRFKPYWNMYTRLFSF